MVYVYVVTNTTIFFVVYLLLLGTTTLHVLAITVGHFMLYMRNLSISCANVCGEFTVCGVGWVRDLVLCWRKGCGQGLFRELC